MKTSFVNKNLAWVALVAGLLAVSVPAARATLTCNSWQSGSVSGTQVFGCNFYTGYTGGTYGNSYQCINQTYGGYCSVGYTGGNAYQGPCTIVCTTTGGQNYYCDLSNWDGRQTIQCNYLPQGCKEIKIECRTPSAVPEPATILAGALLLVPLGISMTRILRRNKIPAIG